MKHAVVTGASTGIGRAVSVGLGGKGWTVILTSRSVPGLEETGRLVDKAGGRGVVIPADLSDQESIDSLVKNISNNTEKINLLANIAGVWHGADQVYAGKPLETFDPGVISSTISVGITAPLLLVRGLLPLMSSGSHIVNLSGTFENGGSGWLPYFVSKRALEDFTLGLSEELRESGIRVNCISPSDTSTEEYIRFFPEDVAGGNSPVTVASALVDLVGTDRTGEFIVVKNNQVLSSSIHT